MMLTSGHRYLRVHAIVLVATTVFALTNVSTAHAVTGMVADSGTNSVTVFNGDTDTVLGAVTISNADVVGDCSITADQRLGFVTNFNSQVSVVDLTATPPALAGGTNPISISNFGEDTALSPDDRFLLVCDGSAVQPISVIDIAARAEISTFNLGSDCNSIDVCSDGSVLVTSTSPALIRRLRLDASGNLSDTGESLSISDPNNVFCAPDGRSGVAILREAAQITTFSIPGLSPSATRSLSGNFGISGLIAPSGTALYARSNGGFIDAFNYDPSTATLGSSPFFSSSISDTPTFYGMDQVALHPSGHKLYVSQPSALAILDAGTGAAIGSITDPSISSPTGVCFPRSVCGDGIVQPGEQCDDGLLNGTAESCCTVTCTSQPSGTACDDGNACTQTDQCNASGACVGSNPVTCTPTDQCHDAGTCDPTNGSCSNPTKADGTSCDDGNACTQTDTCQAGTCTGSNPVVCSADQCHSIGTCNPETGVCSTPPAPAGTACDDGNPCTGPDTCDGMGQCSCGPLVLLGEPGDIGAAQACLASLPSQPNNLVAALQCTL